VKKLIIGVAVLFAVLSQGYGQQASDFTVRLNDDKASFTITGYRGTEKNIRIPKNIEGIPVTAIAAAGPSGRGMFEDKQLTGVIIPDGITYIGTFAFAKNKLTSVTIPDSVTYIGDNAFIENKLTSVTIGNGVTTIGSYAFAGGDKWSLYTSGYNNITTLTLGNSVTTIEQNAFSWNQLTSVVIPNSVISIGETAFWGNQLTTIVIPDSVSSIKRAAFAHNQLTSITISGFAVSIENGAFLTNPPLNKVVIVSNGIAMYEQTISLAFSLIYNKNEWQAGTYTLEDDGWKVVLSPNAVPFHKSVKQNFDVQMNGKNKILIAKYLGKDKNVVIPDNVEGIPVTYIGERAFSGNQLTSVTIPDSVTYIGNYAFSGNQLTSVTIGNDVRIENSAFDDSVFISYYNSNGKKSGLYQKSGNTWKTIFPPTIIQKDNFKIIINNNTNTASIAEYQGEDKNIVIPDSINGIHITAIEENAFLGKELTSITIGSGVTLASNSFESSFINFYNSLGKKAGLYQKRDAAWIATIQANNLKFEISNNTATVIGYLGQGTVVIPDSIDGIPVVSIGSGVFSGNLFTSITIGSGITLVSNSFESGFYDFYAKNKQKAGIYEKDKKGKWKYTKIK
jgi:hypothetical protein